MYKKYAAKLGVPKGYARKILLIMRLTTVILLLSLMQVSASTMAQRVSLSVRKAALEDVLKAIRDQSGYDMVLDRKLLLKAKPVDVDLKSVTLKDALNAVLSEQPLTFALEDKIIIFAEKVPSFIDNLINIFKEIDVYGRIVDEKGLPMPGTTVTVTSGKFIRRVIANANGEFAVKSVPEDAVISISCLGYKTKTVVAKANLSSIVLEMANSELDEVQVQGYGITSKRFSTGNISTVKADEIERQPISNPLLAIAGRMSGVLITEGSGVAGSNFNIVIQGQNSIYAGKLPLYIIDGVPFGGKPIENTVGVTGSSAAIVGTSGFSPLNTLSPNDIESINVLKDADATAIYGSRAANGVVLITTKKGKKGKTNIDADLYTGTSKIGRNLPMLNAGQYLDIRNQAFANDKITPTTTNAADLTAFAPGWDTNMQKYVAGNTGHFTNANLTISGGENSTQFLVSGNFRRESTVIPGDFADLKAQSRFNVQHFSNDRRFSVSANASITKENNHLAPFSLSSVYALPPNLPIKNTDGSLAWYTGYTNPLSTLQSIYNHDVFNLLSNMSLSYELVKGLSIKTDVGYNRININDVRATLKRSKDPSSASAATGSTTLYNTTNELYLVEPQIAYNRLIGKGKLDAFIGGTYQYTHFVQPIFVLGTFTNDALYNDIVSLTLQLKGSGDAENKYASVFGRLNYNWNKKYILNATYRRDGSSKFSPGNRYGNFGSLGAAWVFSEEEAVNQQLSWLSFGKIRSSYGSIGNDQIDDYGYIPYYYSSAVAYGGVSGLYPGRLANNVNYTWEQTKKFNLSIDLGFFKDRLLLTGSYYRNKTENVLLKNVPIASQAGFPGYTGNLPGTKVENKGFELELNATNLKSKDLSWRTGLNFTLSRNKLLSYPDLENSAYATGYPGDGFVIGKSLNLLVGYQYTGFENGLPTVKDQNNDGKISTGLFDNGKGDFLVLGTSDPKFYGGLNNSISYKGFQLDFFFQFVKKDGYNIFRSTGYPGSNNNLPASILDYPFTYSSLPGSAASSAFTNYFKLSDVTVSDASYIRLKNVSMAYNFPENWLSPLRLKRGNIYLRAQNLFTITNYKGIDPETLGTNIPPLKLVTIGLQASF